MRQSLFALFRGAEGRGLARALAALLFVAAIAGQFPLGLHNAVAGDAPVICTVTADAPPAAPAHGNELASCCAAICSGSLAPMVQAEAPGLALPPFRPDAAPPPRPDAAAFAPASVSLHGPRGPPFLG
ncbi:hypothetical protein BH10PSE9_BH10PSE9_17870 [soil metagenome]